MDSRHRPVNNRADPGPQSEAALNATSQGQLRHEDSERAESPHRATDHTGPHIYPVQEHFGAKGEILHTKDGPAGPKPCVFLWRVGGIGDAVVSTQLLRSVGPQPIPTVIRKGRCPTRWSHSGWPLSLASPAWPHTTSALPGLHCPSAFRNQSGAPDRCCISR